MPRKENDSDPISPVRVKTLAGNPSEIAFLKQTWRNVSRSINAKGAAARLPLLRCAMRRTALSDGPAYLLNRFLPKVANPTRPLLRRSSVPGSGTGRLSASWENGAFALMS